MDDQCAFEELSAILDQDEANRQSSVPDNTKTCKRDDPLQESSDDDIGEDELDKLAALTDLSHVRNDVLDDSMVRPEKISQVKVTTDSEPCIRKHSKSVLLQGASMQVDRCHNLNIQTAEKLTATVNMLKTKSNEAQITAKCSTSLQQDFFGDDSGSDWEDLDGEKSERLSKSGKEIKKNISKSVRSREKRIAHEPKFEHDQLINKKHTSWSHSSNKSRSNAVSQEETNFGDDVFSGIRVINPLISTLEMRSRMTSRIPIQLSHLHKCVNSLEKGGDWVTIGVLVNKSEPKMSAKNTQYSVWKLCDLKDCDKLVTMFLFGTVHKELWKHTVGSVIGLLNPTPLKNSDKYQKKNVEECSITVDNAQKVMLIGTSKDLATCKSRTKAGNMCNNVINITKGAYCTYHVQTAYKKSSAKRSELQNGFTGVTPKSFEKKLFNKKGSTVMYGGQSYTSCDSKGGAARDKNAISLNGLKHHALKQTGVNKTNTLTVHNLLPELKEVQNQYTSNFLVEEEEKANHKTFHKLLSTPTSGASNFVKHLAKKENTSLGEKSKMEKSIKYVSPVEFLKNAEKERIEKEKKRKEKKIYDKLGITSANELLLALPPPRLKLKEAMKQAPSLGKGIVPGSDVDLDDSVSSFYLPTKSKNSKCDIAKKKAVEKIKAIGGLCRNDPNAIKTVKTCQVQKKLKRKLAENYEYKTNDKLDAPSKKKSKLLGGLDLDDPAVQDILNSKSSHAVALTQEQLEKQDQYFDVLEKKEAMEEKMAGIHKVKWRAASCKECKYTAFSASQLCKHKGHQIKYIETYKRFFKCKICQHRTVALDKLPKYACQNCGSSSFEKTSMLQEKHGPKLPGEDFLLRGEERKFVNS